MTPTSKRKRARSYIYKKQFFCENFIYIYKKHDNFQKARQFPLLFYSQKAWHFTLRDLHDFFEIGIYIYTKSMTICVTWYFNIQKNRHFEKSKTMCITFYIHKKPDTLCSVSFHGIFEIGGGSGAFLLK